MHEINGACYHFDDLASAAAAGVVDLNGTVIVDEFFEVVPGPMCLTARTFGDPDPETAERAVTSAPKLSKPFVILGPAPLPALAAHRIYPVDMAGFARLAHEPAMEE